MVHRLQCGSRESGYNGTSQPLASSLRYFMTAINTAITRFNVFVPGDFPQHSYVRRVFQHRRTGEEMDPEEMIKDALKQPGIIAQVVGPSKSGKTRAVQNCVGDERLVSIAGSQIEGGLSLWEVVLRKLREPSSVESSNTTGTTMGAELKTKVTGSAVLASVEVEGTGNLERAQETGQTNTVEVDAFQAAVGALKAQNRVLFLDDFHTIPEEKQPAVAAQLKAAAQFGVKICLAEVPHHSDSTISALPDLTGRVQKIEFQYWSHEDLKQIGMVGFGKLNVRLTPAALNAFALEASGSPQLMQLICLHAAARGKINEAARSPVLMQFSTSDLRTIFLLSHSTVDRERIFAILDKGPDERGNPRNRYAMIVLGTGDNYEIALAAIALSPPMSVLTWNGGGDNFSKRIDRVCTSSQAKPAKGQITRALEQMQALAEKHMPRQPILEWNPATGLQILDPYFLFHLRWSEKYEQVRKALDHLE